MSAAVAALDLGTNTFLMLVARASRGAELEVLDDLCRTPRLGAGLAASGALSGDAMARGWTVLEEFRSLLAAQAIPPERVRAVGTAALRRARNAREFIAGARDRTGLEVEVISEDEEARLGYFAVAAERSNADVWILDPGGGSTELVAERGRVKVSAPVGAVVLTETCQGSLAGAAYTDSQWAKLQREVERAFARFPLARELAEPTEVVCLGGTAANLACLELALPEFDPSRVEGFRIARERVELWAERLRRLALEARLAFPVERERAAILPAGLACVAGVMKRLDIQSARGSGRGLRYGVMRELLQRFRAG